LVHKIVKLLIKKNLKNDYNLVTETPLKALLITFRGLALLPSTES
jgi:hypothetical protein